MPSPQLLTDALASDPVLGYLDPGSGSLFVQGVVAVAAGALVGIGAFYGRIKQGMARLFGRKPATKTDTHDASAK